MEACLQRGRDQWCRCHDGHGGKLRAGHTVKENKFGTTVRHPLKRATRNCWKASCNLTFHGTERDCIIMKSRYRSCPISTSYSLKVCGLKRLGLWLR
jgi:hypothetical protein